MKITLNSSSLVALFFAIISFCKGFGMSNNNRIYLYVYVLSLFFLVVKTIKDKFSKKEMIIIFTLLILGVLDYYGKDTTLLFTTIALACLKNIDIDNILKIMLYSRVIAFILNILLSNIGVIEKNIIVFYRNGIFLNRYSFGYGTPNTAHSALSIIIMLLCYTYYKKIKTHHIIALELLNYYFYSLTYSRTGFIIVSLYLFVIFISKHNNIIVLIIKKLLNPMFIIFIIISFALGILYGVIPEVNKLDMLLTGRIKFINTLITSYPIPLIKTQIYKSIVFDNGYVDLLYNGGLIAAIILIIMQIKANILISKYGKKELLIYCAFSFIYCLTESFYMSILMNPALIYLSISLYAKNEKLFIEDSKKEKG